MVKLTKQQRKALHGIFCRSDNWHGPDKPASYREFRKTVVPLFGNDPCVMVPAAGMYIGIEADGYTHT